MMKQNETILLIANEAVLVWIAPLAEAVRCIKVTIFCCPQILFERTFIG